MEFVSYDENEDNFSIVWNEEKCQFKVKIFKLSPRIVINLLLDVAEKNDSNAKRKLLENWIKMYKNKKRKFVETKNKWFLTIKRAAFLASEIRRCHWNTCAGIPNSNHYFV